MVLVSPLLFETGHALNYLRQVIVVNWLVYYSISSYLCEHDIYVIMRMKLTNIIRIILFVYTVRWQCPHVEPRINKIHIHVHVHLKLSFFEAKSHKFLGYRNNL